MNPVVDFLTTRDGYTFEEGVAVLVKYADRNVVAKVSASRDRRLLDYELRRLAHDPSLKGLCQDKAEPAKTEQKTVVVPPMNEHGSEKTAKNEQKKENIVTFDDLNHHRFTRYEDMPNKLTKYLWLKNRDEYNLKREKFIKMKQCMEGEELAALRKEVVELGHSIKARWNLIEKEISLYSNEKNEKPSFNVSTYRTYICRKLKMEKLSDKELVELQHRVDAMIETGASLDEETLIKLREKGISC